MQVDINDINQKLLGKIIKAMENSDFALCTNLSSEMIRISDYVDFIDGIFFGEFFESLFSNINSINAEYVIEEAVINNLKSDIINLISILRDSIPLDDNNKINIYNLITNIRAKASRLQLESFRGERKRKIRRKTLEDMKREDKISDITELLE